MLAFVMVYPPVYLLVYLVKETPTRKGRIVGTFKY